MTNLEFQQSLKTLHLTYDDAAKQLSKNSRTISRWADGTIAIPTPVEEVLRAWIRLHRLGLAWQADTEMLGKFCTEEDVVEQISLLRQHSIELDTLIQTVNARGGPSAPWQVDLGRRRATLGPIWVSFYLLKNGSFSPQLYSRTDMEPDQIRDATLIQDAYACIANAISAGGANSSESK